MHARFTAPPASSICARTREAAPPHVHEGHDARERRGRGEVSEGRHDARQAHEAAHAVLQRVREAHALVVLCLLIRAAPPLAAVAKAAPPAPGSGGSGGGLAVCGGERRCAGRSGDGEAPLLQRDRSDGGRCTGARLGAPPQRRRERRQRRAGTQARKGGALRPAAYREAVLRSGAPDVSGC